MRVFVTGASGFVGSAVVKELLQAGHQVLGLVRRDDAAEALIRAGAEAHRGDINDLDSVKSGAAGCDAVIHTAFDHDFNRYQENCEKDRQVILALGTALAGSARPLVVTSGVGLQRKEKGSLTTEHDVPPGSGVVPRAASEEAARAVAAQGVNVYILRLPPTTHGAGDHGFIPMVIGIDREKGESAYIGAGDNCWPAVHRLDAAVMYRLIIERQPELKVYHAVAEEGIPFKQIAEVIGKGLNLPVASKEGAAVEAHFGGFSHFAAIDCRASAELSRKALGWEPLQAGLLEDLVIGGYFSTVA